MNKTLKRIGCLALLGMAFLGTPEAVVAGPGEKPADARTALLKAYEEGPFAVANYVRAQGTRLNCALLKDMAHEGTRKRDAVLVEAAWSAAVAKEQPGCEADLALVKAAYHAAISENAAAEKGYADAKALFVLMGNARGQGKATLGLGQLANGRGRNADALRHLQEASALFSRGGDEGGLAAVALTRGDLASRRGEDEAADAHYGEARRRFRGIGDKAGEGQALRRQGDLDVKLRRFAPAREHYDAARPLLQGAGDLVGEADIHYGLGMIALRTGDADGAQAMAAQAMTLYERMSCAAGIGRAYTLQGEIPFYAGENEKARDLYDRALHFFRRAEEPTGEGFALRRKGLLYLRIGENEKALAMLRAALDLYTRAEDPLGQADVAKATGDTHFFTRDYARALEMYDRALPLFARLREPVGQANVYRAMGDIYFFTGDNVRATQMFDKALMFYKAASSPIGQGNTYHSLGDVYLRSGDAARATEMQRAAIPLFMKAGSVTGLGDSWKSLGDIALRSGQAVVAKESYERALAFFGKANSVTGQGNVRVGLGDAALRAGDPDAALREYEQAAVLFRKMEDIELEALVLFRKAGILAGRGSRHEARRLYEEGVSRLERTRRQAVFPDMKRGFLEKVYDHYEAAAVFMLENRYNDRAFAFIEAMKARTFLDALSESQVNLDKGIDRDLKEKRDALDKHLALVRRRIVEESQQQAPREDLLVRLRKDRQTLEGELEALRREIRYKNPLYAAVQYPEPVALPTLQNAVLRRDEVLLEYFLSSRGWFVAVLTRDRFDVLRLPGDPSVLERRLDTHLRGLRGPVSGETFSEDTAFRLYQDLIAPAGPLGNRTILVVPHGVLAHLPFESLRTGSGRNASFLVESHRIKYVQSATILWLLRTKMEKSRAPERFIGFGDPVYDYDNFKAGRPETGSDARGGASVLTRGGYTRAGGKLYRLEGSGEEIRQIEAIFASSSRAGTRHLREAAREEAAKDAAMGDYGYIHFSTHGILDASFQAIALSQLPGAGEDGFLTLGEIMNSRYNARLVVLSACETGLGALDRGEGVTGLTRAVMYAGTPAAVVSLWSVSDEGTKELMIRFYRHLIPGKLSVDEALRAAKREMIAGGASAGARKGAPLRSIKVAGTPAAYPFRHPYFWSAFVMYGE